MSNPQYILPGERIPLSEDELKQLGGRICEIVESFEMIHSELSRRVEVDWDLYHAKPAFERRTEPWPDASNVVPPLIRTHTDGLSARLANTVFATQDLWIETQTDEALGDLPHELMGFMNAGARGNEFEALRPITRWIHEGNVTGDSVLGLQWGRRVKHLIDPLSLRGNRKPRVVEVPVHNGPVLYPIPRQSIMWEPNKPIDDSSVVVRQLALTFPDLIRRTQQGEQSWLPDQVNAIKGHTHIGSHWGRPRRMGNRLFDLGRVPAELQLYDVREVWIDLLTLGKFGLDIANADARQLMTPAVVVHFHRDTKRILNVIAAPYALKRWPFYQYAWGGDTYAPEPKGTSRILEHMQAALATLVNQSIDAVTFANSMVGITTDPKLLDAIMGPGRWHLVTDPSEQSVRLLQPAKTIQPDIALVQLLLALAERAVPTFDRENRVGGHPSPATSTLTLLEEKREVVRPTLRLLRFQLSRLGEDIATLYQQFTDLRDDRYERLVGAEDGQKVKQLLFDSGQPVGQITGFDVRALTEDTNPQAAVERAIRVDTATNNLFARLMQALGIIDQVSRQSGGQVDPQNPIIRLATSYMNAITESYRDVLKASNVDDFERFFAGAANTNANQLTDDLRQRLAAAFPEVGGPEARPDLPLGPGDLAVEQSREPVQ